MDEIINTLLASKGISDLKPLVDHSSTMITKLYGYKDSNNRFHICDSLLNEVQITTKVFGNIWVMKHSNYYFIMEETCLESEYDEYPYFYSTEEFPILILGNENEILFEHNGCINYGGYIVTSKDKRIKTDKIEKILYSKSDFLRHKSTYCLITRSRGFIKNSSYLFSYNNNDFFFVDDQDSDSMGYCIVVNRERGIVYEGNIDYLWLKGSNFDSYECLDTPGDLYALSFANEKLIASNLEILCMECDSCSKNAPRMQCVSSIELDSCSIFVEDYIILFTTNNEYGKNKVVSFNGNSFASFTIEGNIVEMANKNLLIEHKEDQGDYDEITYSVCLLENHESPQSYIFRGENEQKQYAVVGNPFFDLLSGVIDKDSLQFMVPYVYHRIECESNGYDVYTIVSIYNNSKGQSLEYQGLYKNFDLVIPIQTTALCFIPSNNRIFSSIYIIQKGIDANVLLYGASVILNSVEPIQVSYPECDLVLCTESDIYIIEEYIDWLTVQIRDQILLIYKGEIVCKDNFEKVWFLKSRYSNRVENKNVVFVKTKNKTGIYNGLTKDYQIPLSSSFFDGGHFYYAEGILYDRSLNPFFDIGDNTLLDICSSLLVLKKGNEYHFFRILEKECLEISQDLITTRGNGDFCYFCEDDNTLYKFEIHKNKLSVDFPYVENWYNEPDDNDYDDDSWGAKAELDYIRNNGGDWIDD